MPRWLGHPSTQSQPRSENSMRACGSLLILGAKREGLTFKLRASLLIDSTLLFTCKTLSIVSYDKLMLTCILKEIVINTVMSSQ
jgi:hypothetical protein